ncbi:MAG: hypothetical protein JXQ87_12425 [Bacteroidia bacterium]
MSKLEFLFLVIITLFGVYPVTHFPGSGPAITLSFFLFGVFTVYKSVQLKSVTSLLLGTGYFFYLFGALFKLMHWPYAGLLLMLSILLVFGSALFFIELWKKEGNSLQKISAFTINLGVLLLPIYFILLTFTTFSGQLLSSLFNTIPIFIVIPTLLLLITKPVLYRKKSIYSLLLIIAASELAIGFRHLERFIVTLF